MGIRDFQLERFFAAHEFTARCLLSPSDCESMSLEELLALADADSLEQWRQLQLGYTQTAGHPILRAEIARLYPGASSDDILVCAPEEGIFIAMHVLLQPGDRVVVTAPCYQSLAELPTMLGCAVDRWAVRTEGNRWTLDPDDLVAALTPQTRLVIVNFPHNPTGYTPSADVIARLVELTGSRGLYVFSDEMYRFLEHRPECRSNSLLGAHERVVALGGLSKAFGLPGLRVGWLATRDRRLLDRCAAFKDYTTICSAAPAEVLAIMALRRKNEIIAANRRIIGVNLEACRTFCQEQASRVDWLEPDGGSTAFPRLRPPLQVDEFCERLLRRRSVLAVPGRLFDWPGGYFRVGLGRRNLPEVLSIVAQELEPGSSA
ncbi:MAG: aminotransferase class I/II-fold pyridoxal phosphate-dependent enzyme [Acidobacteria bacterium]|nr:aminotransferase class I/II-fold pyridoxal phosphate-dependent enzyme [Acidobacteriota bacterium]